MKVERKCSFRWLVGAALVVVTLSLTPPIAAQGWWYSEWRQFSTLTVCGETCSPGLRYGVIFSSEKKWMCHATSGYCYDTGEYRERFVGYSCGAC
ncbi:MAG: hypothetical protein K0U98_00820 [Deltaproteobacteria bacterium]|nr:hypothetical protein [Deltaproteobacteria bacterium]